MRAENLGEAKVVVISSAVKRDNPEVMAPRARVCFRWCAGPRCWASSCVSNGRSRSRGTHGKTTTTSMVARAARCGAARSHRHQWRHHQRLRHQRAARRRRLDGGRGRRERRHLRQAAGDHRRRHQHRSRAPRFLRQFRRASPAPSSSFVEQHPLLRLRRALHRPSRRAGHDPRAFRAAHRHLWLEPASRHPRRQHRGRALRRSLRRRHHRPAQGDEPHHRRHLRCRCSASTTCRIRWPRSPSRRKWASATTSSAARSPASRGSSGASPRPAESRGVTVIDDYGHHPVEIAAVLRARPRRDIGQHHRRGAAASLHAARATCSTSSAPASTTPMSCSWPMSTPPASRRSKASTATPWSRACARAATATRSPSPSPAELARMVHDMTQVRRLRRLPRRRHRSRNWAQTPAGRARPDSRRARARMMAQRRSSARLIDRLPPVRGRISAEGAARAHYLVPRRRPCRDHVPPRRRR